MSAARAGVSAVAINNEPTNAPVKDFAVITSSLWPALQRPAFTLGCTPDLDCQPKHPFDQGFCNALSFPPQQAMGGKEGHGRDHLIAPVRYRRPLQAEHVEHRGRGRVPQ